MDSILRLLSKNGLFFWLVLIVVGLTWRMLERGPQKSLHSLKSTKTKVSKKPKAKKSKQKTKSKKRSSGRFYFVNHSKPANKGKYGQNFPSPSERATFLPLAKKYCDAVYKLRAKKKAKCCKESYSTPTFLGICSNSLTLSVKEGAIGFKKEKVEACIQGIKALHQGCDWVDSLPQPLPEICLGIVEGHLIKGQRCRSHLECRKGLHCAGVGPLRRGRCMPPKEEGYMCGTGVDPLAAYIGQVVLNKDHPECQGFCRKNRCLSRKRIKNGCSADIHCVSGEHCANGKCQKGHYARLGKACTGRCEAGARCVNLRCASLKKIGEACKTDFECRGACLIEKGKKTGKCGMQCRLPFLQK